MRAVSLSCGVNRHPELGLVWDMREIRVRDLLGRSPTGLARYRVRFRYGLLIRIRLLSTLSAENAVTFNYGEVTPSPIRTFTRQFNRIHRRTSYRRQTVEDKGNRWATRQAKREMTT